MSILSVYSVTFNAASKSRNHFRSSRVNLTGMNLDRSVIHAPNVDAEEGEVMTGVIGKSRLVEVADVGSSPLSWV